MENLIEYLNTVFGDGKTNSGLLKFFYQQQYRDFSPDINGYTLIFMVPPDLSGYRVRNASNYNQIDTNSYVGRVSNLIAFAAVDFAPPQTQVNTEQISSRNGAIPYATEVTETDQCSITYVDNSNLEVYQFHHLWVEYMREVMEGVIEPDSQYYDPNNVRCGQIDYAASLYIIKYRPDMKTITFVSKCIGVFPQGLPSKELIGTRTSNELTTLPFTYFCTAYREATFLDRNNSGGTHWILSELNTNILTRFGSASNTNQLLATGSSLGGFIPDISGSNLTSFGNIFGMVSNFTPIPASSTPTGESMGWNEEAGTYAEGYVPSPGETSWLQKGASFVGSAARVAGQGLSYVSQAAQVVNQGPSMLNQGTTFVKSTGQAVISQGNQIQTQVTGFSRIVTKVPKFY
jgi:hypothetical protein